MTALWIGIGLAALIKLASTISIRERGWRLLEEAYGFRVRDGDSARELRGALFGVELRLWNEKNSHAGGKVRTRIEVAQPTPGWSCAYYNKALPLAAIGRATAIADAELDRCARYVPAPSHGAENYLPEAAREILVSWFHPSKFPLRRSVVRWVRIGDDVIEIDIVGPGLSEKSLEQRVAQVVAFASALRGTALPGPALAQIRQARLPMARVLPAASKGDD